jgi:plastocyanin
MTDDRTRRTFLRTTGIAAASLAIAGCSGGSGSNTDDGGGGGGGDDGDSSGGSGDGWTETSTIEMTDELAYAPKKAKVSKGTTITFENTGSIGHTVTAYGDKIPDGASYFASGGYDSEKKATKAYENEQGGNVPKGETYEVTLDTAGEYEYYCIPHELSGMTGTIKVE